MGTRMRRSDARKPTKPKAVLLIPMCAKGGGEMAWGCYFGGVDQGGDKHQNAVWCPSGLLSWALVVRTGLLIWRSRDCGLQAKPVRADTCDGIAAVWPDPISLLIILLLFLLRLSLPCLAVVCNRKCYVTGRKQHGATLAAAVAASHN